MAVANQLCPVLLWCLFGLSSGLFSINQHDLVHRVTDSLQVFLNTTHFPTSQIVESFRIGLVQPNDSRLDSKLLRILTSQLLSVHNIGSFTVSFAKDRQMVGVCREAMSVFTTQQFSNTTCAQNNTCLSQFSLDGSGSPTTFQGTVGLELTDSFFTNKESSHWTPVSYVSPTALGVTYSRALYDHNKTHIGRTSASLTLSQLDSFLSVVVAETSPDAVVYILNSKLRLLVSSSVPNVTANSSPTLSVNHYIRESSQLIFSCDNWKHGVLRSHNEIFVLTRNLGIRGLDWTVVATGNMETTDSYIAASSTSGLVVIAVSFVLFLGTGWLIGWVLQFRTLQLWHAAHPWMMIGILISNLGCIVSSISQLGKPSSGLCIARASTLTFCMTVCAASLLGKMLLIRAETHPNHFAGDDMTIKFRRIHIAIASIVGVQVLFLCVWMVFDPNRVQLVQRSSGDSDEITEECGSNTVLGFLLTRGCLVLTSVCGCVLGFCTRNARRVFGESRALFFVFLHGVLLVFSLIAVAKLGDVEPSSLNLFVIVSLFWFVVTTQMVLFIPRITRQVIVGDLSLAEVRALMIHQPSPQTNLQQNNPQQNNPQHRTQSEAHRQPTRVCPTKPENTYVM